MPPGPMVLRLAWDEQYYTQDDFLLWYGRERGFEIWEEAGNVEDSNFEHVDQRLEDVAYEEKVVALDKRALELDRQTLELERKRRLLTREVRGSGKRRRRR